MHWHCHDHAHGGVLLQLSRLNSHRLLCPPSAPNLTPAIASLLCGRGQTAASEHFPGNPKLPPGQWLEAALRLDHPEGFTKARVRMTIISFDPDPVDKEKSFDTINGMKMSFFRTCRSDWRQILEGKSDEEP